MKRTKDLSPASDRRVLLMKQRSSAIETPDLHYPDKEEEESKLSNSDSGSSEAESTPRTSELSEREVQAKNLDVDDLTTTPKKQSSILSQTMGP